MTKNYPLWRLHMTSGMTLTPRTPEITQNPISKSLLTCNPVRERRPMCPKADVKIKINARDKERTPTSVLIFLRHGAPQFHLQASLVLVLAISFGA